MQQFNVLMADLGDKILPGVTKYLGDFKWGIDRVRNMLPGGEAKKDSALATTMARAGEFATVGGLWGAAGGPGGALGGAIGGGVLGTAESFMEQYNEPWHLGLDKAGSYTSPGKTGRAAEPKTVNVTPPPTYLTIQLDGKTIASAISNAMNPYGGFPSQAPGFDGLGSAREGDDHQPDR
jgi:hypothetical protein